MWLSPFGPKKEDRPPPKFCKHCGSTLVPNDRVLGYDEYTGTPIQPLIDVKVCKNFYCKNF